MLIDVPEITCCRLCASHDLVPILNCGKPYLSDFLLPGENGVQAPLEVVFCRACGLTQLHHTVPRDLLYRDKYWYRSGTNETMVAELSDIVQTAMEMVGPLGPMDHVMDIGANDGTLLGFYPAGPWKIAVEPSADTFHQQLGGYMNAPGYWPDVAWGIPEKCKIITSVACFYDADDPHAFVEEIRTHLTDDGVWICQMQTADFVRRHIAFDYWCHEHLCLWDSSTFGRLLSEHGLRLVDEWGRSINGGSSRFIIRKHRGTPDGFLYQPVSLTSWYAFGERVERLKQDAKHRLWQLSDSGETVLGVGASTKANTVLQYYGLNTGLIRAIVERAPEKFGRRTVGSDIPIVSEEQAAAMDPDYYVALAWQFLDGLRQRAPDKPFLTLLPEVKRYPALTWQEAHAAHTA